VFPRAYLVPVRKRLIFVADEWSAIQLWTGPLSFRSIGFGRRVFIDFQRLGNGRQTHRSCQHPSRRSLRPLQATSNSAVAAHQPRASSARPITCRL